MSERDNQRAASPLRPKAAGTGVRKRFTRGNEHPRGVVWFGVTSFWGHLRHFLAAAIATEDVDSRDWMTPDEPSELAARIARELGANSEAASLSEALGRVVRYGGDDLVTIEQRLKTTVPAWHALDLRLMIGRYQSDGAVATADDIARLTALLAHAPRSYRDFAKDAAALWAKG